MNPERFAEIKDRIEKWLDGDASYRRADIRELLAEVEQLQDTNKGLMGLDMRRVEQVERLITENEGLKKENNKLKKENNKLKKENESLISPMDSWKYRGFETDPDAGYGGSK